MTYRLAVTVAGAVSPGSYEAGYYEINPINHDLDGIILKGCP